METTPGDYGAPRDEQELAAAAGIMTHSYAMAPDAAAAWTQRVGPSGGLRLMREGGRVAGTLVSIPMGQWYGGRHVPIIGVGGVGVSPVYRGQGTATRLMQSVLREARESGAPLSTLYPATQPLYRRVGYEHAGARYEIRVQVPMLDVSERSLTLRHLEAKDEAAVAEGYQRVARGRQGWLARGPYVWSRVYTPRDGTAVGYVVEGASGVEGHLFVVRKPLAGWRQELFLPDVVANTPTAARRILDFLGDHRSLVSEAVWYGGADDPLLLFLREQSYTVKLDMHWMVRVLDVAKALEARGWPAGLSGSLHLEVEDDLFPENRGRYVLEVSGGEARVRRGGDGSLRLHVRGLSPLYTGYQSAQTLRMAGLLEADDATVRAAGALFSGPQPTLRDMF